CFFFQAEDGIRDFHVTGVQTCALPILQQRMPGLEVADAGVLRTAELVAGDPDPLFGERAARYRLRVRAAEQLPHLRLDRLQLVLRGALAPGHAVAAVGVLDEQRHRREPVSRVESVAA